MMEHPVAFGTPLRLDEWALASYDETSLEEQLIGFSKRDDEFYSEYRIAFKDALRAVDALKMSGKYPKERSRLKKILEDAEEEVSHESRKAFDRRWKSPQMIEYLSHVSNLLAGTQSPDPEQRTRFLALMDELGLWNKTPREVPTALLRSLERAKRPKGRKSIPTPWANVTEHMDAMRVAVADGASIYEAARTRAALEKTAGEAERARTLAKLYRQKMALRE